MLTSHCSAGIILCDLSQTEQEARQRCRQASQGHTGIDTGRRSETTLREEETGSPLANECRHYISRCPSMYPWMIWQRITHQSPYMWCPASSPATMPPWSITKVSTTCISGEATVGIVVLLFTCSFMISGLRGSLFWLVGRDWLLIIGGITDAFMVNHVYGWSPDW